MHQYGMVAQQQVVGGYQIPVRSTVLQITRIGIEGITKNGSFSFIHVQRSMQLLQPPPPPPPLPFPPLEVPTYTQALSAYPSFLNYLTTL
jgi:hypothetical protein